MLGFAESEHKKRSGTHRSGLIDRAVKDYDPSLFATTDDGKTVVMRYDWVTNSSHFVLALTDNWKMHGKPVDMGTMYVTQRLRETDGWHYDHYDDVVRQREESTRLSDRRYKNEVKAIAYDIRREFAKATNDINTSTL